PAPERTWHTVRNEAIRDGSKRRAGAVRAGGSAMLMTETTSMKEDGKYMIATASRPGARVLVVEDDDEMRSLVAELLTEQGYRVTAEPDTLSGLIHLLSDGADVLVVDWKMPDLDGLELLGTVRRCFPDVPVVFVSAFATPELYYRAMQEGAFSFLAKPFRRDELVAEIEGALQFLTLRLEGKVSRNRRRT